MGALLLEIPDVLYQAALEIAMQENISVNQLVTLALAEKISTLMTEDYRSERAERGDREKFCAALAKVPDVEPDEEDRL